MADQLCTPTDLAALLDKDLYTEQAIVVIEAATAVVQSLVGERIVGAYPPESAELQLARATVLSLAVRGYTDPPGLDYEAAYEVAAVVMKGCPHWRAALRLQYDRRAALAETG